MELNKRMSKTKSSTRINQQIKVQLILESLIKLMNSYWRKKFTYFIYINLTAPWFDGETHLVMANPIPHHSGLFFACGNKFLKTSAACENGGIDGTIEYANNGYILPWLWLEGRRGRESEQFHFQTWDRPASAKIIHHYSSTTVISSPFPSTWSQTSSPRSITWLKDRCTASPEANQVFFCFGKDIFVNLPYAFEADAKQQCFWK